MKTSNILVLIAAAAISIIVIWMVIEERFVHHPPPPPKEVVTLPPNPLDTAIKIQDSFYEYIVMVEKGVISRATMDKICQPLKPKLDSIIATLSTADRHRFDSISQEHANLMIYKLAN